MCQWVRGLLIALVILSVDADVWMVFVWHFEFAIFTYIGVPGYGAGAFVSHSIGIMLIHCSCDIRWNKEMSLTTNSELSLECMCFVSQVKNSPTTILLYLRLVFYSEGHWDLTRRVYIKLISRSCFCNCELRVPFWRLENPVLGLSTETHLQVNPSSVPLRFKRLPVVKVPIAD